MHPAIILLSFFLKSAVGQITPESDSGHDAYSGLGRLSILTEAKGDAADAEILSFYQNARPAWLKGRALVALAQRIGSGALDKCLKNSKSKDPCLRSAAFEALGFIASGHAAVVLKEGLKDSHPKTRWSAAASLARMNGSKAWEDIRPLIAQADLTTVGLEVLALGFILTDESRARMGSLTSHADRKLRFAAIRAMHRAEDTWCASHLLKLLADCKDAELRRVIHGVLLSYDENFIAEPLASVIHSGEVAKLESAIELLTHRPDIKSGDALAERLEKDGEKFHSTVLLKALDTLLAINVERYQKALVRYLESNQPSVRSRAVMALTVHQTEVEMFRLLQKPLSDPDDGVFRQALGLLQSSTTDTPKEGLADYLRPALEKSSLGRASSLLKFLKARLPDKELIESLKLLSPFLGHSDTRVRKLAVDVFSRATDETLYTKVAQAQGFITDWMILGPFDNDKLNSGFQKKWPPEEEINIARTYEGGSQRARFILKEKDVQTTTLTWQEHKVAFTDGRISLNRLLTTDADYFIAYATAELRSDADSEAVLQIRSDDGFRCWLNGELVAAAGDQPLDPKLLKDRQKWMTVRNKWKNNIHTANSKISLKKGKNRILLKLGNFTDFWHFSVRVERNPAQ